MRSCFPCLCALLILWPLRLLAEAPQETHQSPLSPQAALKHFRTPPGTRLELVASEPQIESPVAMAFAPDGKLWVVEMRDYPNGPAPGQPPEGRIKVLEDRDRDGFYETATLFADRLLFANGLLFWKNGVLVTAAPHIVFLQDRDGDGKADVREVLYEGFSVQNPQLRVSHPILGLDGWVTVANGLRGGAVRRAGTDAPPVSLAGMDFRFNLQDGRYEAISGLGQFGNTFDDYGNRFVCDNRHHLRHIVLEARYVKRNPFLAVPDVVQDTSVLEDGPLSSGGKIYPLSKNWTTSSLHVGRFTAACGIMIYRGDLLAPEHTGTALTCDPTGNLIHQEKFTSTGGSFVSRPTTPGKEFLATPDDWFRPVSLGHGPDGALYIVDMYRAVIEHPEFMPTELKTRPDLTLGKDRGRIWRLVPSGHKGPSNREIASRLAWPTATPETLVEYLDSKNPWVRTTAHRLLVERRDPAALPALKATLNRPNPLQRLQAAHLLEAQEGVNLQALKQLLADPAPEVRAHAIRFAERLLPTEAGVQAQVKDLAGDSDPRVRFQVACSLGAWDSEDIVAPLARLAWASAEDRWTRLAVQSSVPKRAGALLRAMIGSQKEATAAQRTFVQEVATLVGARREVEEVTEVLQALAASSGPIQRAGLEGVAEGMGRRGTQLGLFLTTLPGERRALVTQITAVLESSSRLASDAKAPAHERLPAVRLLAHAPWDTAHPVLEKLLRTDASQDVRLAALRALAAQPRMEVAPILLKDWRTYTPAVRRETMEVLLRQPERTLALLGEVEAGRIRPGDFDTLRTRQLVNHARPEIRDRARKLLQNNLPAERQKVLTEYRAALTLKGDPQKGQEVFRKNCATCHRVNSIGVDVGPDIADTRTKTAEALLLDILNPNAAIDNNYVNYEVTLKSGKVVTGIIASETASSLTLRRAENQADAILRQDVEEIRSTGVSLMPDGLEKTIPLEDMAHLVSFLKNWRYLDGTVPLRP